MGTGAMVIVIIADATAAYYLVMSCMRLYYRDSSSRYDAALTVADILNHALLIILARATIALHEQPVLIVWPLIASIIFCTQTAMGTRAPRLREALKAKLRARNASTSLQAAAPDS